MGKGQGKLCVKFNKGGKGSRDIERERGTRDKERERGVQETKREREVPREREGY